MRRILTLSAVLLAFATPGLAAQAQSGCEHAEELLRTASSTAMLETARELLADCPADFTIEAVRGAAVQHKGKADPQVVGAIWAPVAFVRDARVATLSLEMAADATASTASRVTALLYLYRFVSPETSATYGHLVGGFGESEVGMRVRGGCEALARPPTWRDGPQPLPADIQTRARQLARGLASDPSQPEDVRTAASCVPQRDHR